MALLRRRRRDEADEPPRDAAPSDSEPKRRASTPEEWVPPEVAFAPRSGTGSAGPRDWIPEGVADRSRAASPPEEAAAPEAPATEAQMRAEVDSLEQQIAVAKSRVQSAREARTGSEPSQAETAAAAQLAQLQGAVLDLRARLERQSGAQRDTIQALEARLATAEEQLRRPAGYKPPGTRLATLARFLLALVLFVVIAGAPLFMTRRTVCHLHTKKDTHWSFVKPFDNSGPPHCQNELGGTVVLHAIGLK